MTSDHGADQGGPGFDVVLRRHRLRANLTQDELAARAHVGVRTVRDLERGRVARPQRTTAELLADALGLTGTDRDAFLAAARSQAPDRHQVPAPDRHQVAAPAPPSRFVPLPPAAELIGRDADLAELAELLTARPPGSRGITLVGLAGVGKTALALRLSHHIAAAHPGGVAGIVVIEGFTAGEILGMVAAVFGAGRAEDLPSRFAGASGVLVIDAVERAPDAVADALSWLLERVPTLRFLATGRHPVGLADERVWPVAPLVVPDGVELFLDRLARVRRTPPDPEEAAALTPLVRRLGGMPLAIELAAARGRVLTVPEILDRYGDRVLDLAGRPGDAVVSLRDAVAASYRLLAPAEQHALRRLAMFRFRWSLALAEQMAGDGVDVVHLLDRLLELGLLGVQGRRAFRFRLLDVVRDYAAERAAAEGELAAGRRRHASVLAGFAERIAPDLAGADLAEAAARLDVVAGDLGAALAFAATEDPHTALRLAAALPRWWRFRGRDVTGRQWLRRLLDDPRTADADPLLRARARIGLAQLAREHGAGAEEIVAVTEALADFRRLGSVDGEFTAHTQLAALWMSAGRYDEARRHGEAALDLARGSGRVRDMAVAENNLTWHEIRQGDLVAARARLAAVDRLAARSGEHRLRALATANLADVERLDGRPEEAVALGRNAIAELDGLGDPNHRRRMLATVGLALVDAGRVDEADDVLAELWPPPATGPAPDGPAAVVAGAVALARGDGERAAEHFARAAAAYQGDHDPRDVVTALVGLAVSSPDPAARRRLDDFCAAGGIVLVPHERARLGR
jgi:predicted ATPase/DNA-binding XRE family transcriptional regulator